MPPVARFALLALALGGVGAAQAGALYCCNDSNGKQVCGDILPQACYGRAYREIGDNGQVRRYVDAPPTAEQRAAREAEEKRRKEADLLLKEQKRKDAALLETYGSERDIEMMRQRAEQDTQAAIRTAEKKVGDARQLRKKYENEAEFYKKKDLPPEVQKGLREADYEIKAQQELVEAKKKELETIQAKYAEDRRRYLELTRGKAAVANPAPR